MIHQSSVFSWIIGGWQYSPISTLPCPLYTCVPPSSIRTLHQHISCMHPKTEGSNPRFLLLSTGKLITLPDNKPCHTPTCPTTMRFSTPFISDNLFIHRPTARYSFILWGQRTLVVLACSGFPTIAASHTYISRSPGPSSNLRVQHADMLPYLPSYPSLSIIRTAFARHLLKIIRYPACAPSELSLPPFYAERTHPSRFILVYLMATHFSCVLKRSAGWVVAPYHDLDLFTCGHGEFGQRVSISQADRTINTARKLYL